MADVEKKPKGRVVTGRVISNKCNQTITVLIERREPHPVYGKYIRRTTKVHAHDEKNECNEGDLVTVRESRPYSKTKFWVLASIDERAPADVGANSANT